MYVCNDKCMALITLKGVQTLQDATSSKKGYQHYKMLLACAITGLDKELEVMHLDSSAQLLKLLTSQGPAIAIKGLNKF